MRDKSSTDDAIAYFTAQYNNWRKKLPALPPLEQLDRDFDVLDTVGRERHFPQNVVKFTRWYMMRTIYSWAGYLHEFILPNPQSAVSMEEYNYFDEKEKQGIIEMLNWIMYRSRASHTLQFDEDVTVTANFIGEVFSEWQTYKPQLKATLEKNAEVWRQKVRR